MAVIRNEGEHDVNDGLLSGLEWMGSSGRKAQLSVCRLWQAASYIISQDAKPNPVPTPRATLHELSAAPRRRRKRGAVPISQESLMYMYLTFAYRRLYADFIALMYADFIAFE